MNTSLATYWRSLATGTRNTIFSRVLLALLVPLSLAYGLVQLLRAALYRCGYLPTNKLPRPVVSIGNISVGGTGKTPLAAHIARFLIEQGFSVVVLSRGYGGSLEGQCALVSDGLRVMLSTEECGDEPFLLASTVPGLAVVIGADRYRAGCFALERLKPDLFLLDDGFQHLRLHRDLNVLLLDYSKPYGNGWTVPAGILREPHSALQRADLVIQTRCPQGSTAAVVSNKPVITSRHELADAVPLSGGEPVSLSELCGCPALAFAGIAEPEYFFEELRRHGINLVKTIALADHTSYSAEQNTALNKAFQDSGAAIVLTTEKDGVKLRGLPDELAARVLLVRLKLVLHDPAQLTGMLRNLLQ